MADKKNLNIGIFALSIIPIILFLFIVSQRISFPYDVEWAEGAALNQVNRILSGERVYLSPSIDFSPLVYTPVYFYLSAALNRLIGSSFLGMRIISVAASLGAFGIIFLLVWKETYSGILGWLSGALYLACFELGSGFYDLARVDSLYVLLLLVGLWFLCKYDSLWSYSAAGFIISAGFFTKQSAVIVFLPILIYLLITNWQRSWSLLVTILLGILIPVIIINRATEGWFNYYVFYLPSEHGYSFVDAVKFWVADLFKPLGIAIGFFVFYSAAFMAEFIKRTDNKKEKSPDGKVDGHYAPQVPIRLTKREFLYLLFTVGALAASWVTRASNGGGSNNAMPAYAAISIMFGLGFNLMVIRVKDNFQNNATLIGLILIQMGGLIYNPFNYIPSEADWTINRSLVKNIEEVTGDALIPYRSHLPGMAGKKGHIHIVGLFELTDYFHGDVQPEGLAIVNQMRKDICDQRYGMIVLDQPIPWFQDQIDAAYTKTALIGSESIGRQSKMLSWQQGYKNLYHPDPDKLVGLNCPD